MFFVNIQIAVFNFAIKLLRPKETPRNLIFEALVVFFPLYLNEIMHNNHTYKISVKTDC